MGLWSNQVIFIFLLLAGASRSQNLGEGCERQDRTRGICRDLNECVADNGQIESANTLELCTSSTFNRVIACCRKTPDILAREKCEEWRRGAAAEGSSCTVNIPLARGGVTANVGEYPHMVSLLMPSFNGRLTHVCGGSLIAKKYVLTAAHCLNNSRIYARIGGHDHTVSESGVTIDVEVIDQILHPNYRQPLRYNDIALLKLRFEVPFSRRVRPACLPFRNTRIAAGTKLVVAGWGVYENAGPTSQVLRKAEVTAIDRFKCDTNPVITGSRARLRYPAGITDSIICADESQSGACSGDSGGPLMLPSKESCDIKDVIGIVSRGILECKSTIVPGTYTRVDYYLDWIIENVWGDEFNKK